VSIKNKLVTAVTTAGLLAGLFGSAFVPAARGADEDQNIESMALASTDADVDATVGSIIYATAGAVVDMTVTFQANNDDADDDINDAGILTVTATGTTISSVTANAYGSVIPSATNKTASGYMTFAAANAGTAGDAFTITVKVLAPADGATATFSTSFDGQDAGTEDASISIVGVASSGSNKPYAGYSGLSGKSAVDLDTAAAGSVIVDADTTNGAVVTLKAATGVRLADGANPAIANGAEYRMQIQSFDKYNVGVTSVANGLIRATYSGTATGGITLSDTNAACSDDSSSSATLSAGLDGTEYVCFQSDGDANGAGTITVTFGGLTYTRSFIVLGASSTVTISGPTHVTSGLGAVAAFNDAITVTCKDDAGTVIGDGGGDVLDYTDGDRGDCGAAALTFTLLDSSNGSTVIATTDTDDAGATTAAALAAAGSVFNDLHLYQNVSGAGFSDLVDTFSVADDGNFDLPTAVCADGDQGETRTLQVQLSAVKKSNVLTMTCVAAKVKITSLTALATGTSGSATSGANGQTIKVSVAATDGYGRPAGTGSSFTFTAVGTGGSTSGATASFGGGSATLTITLGTISGAQYVLYSATDSDQVTTGAQAFAQKISFTVTNSADALVDYVLTKSGAKVTGSNFAARATVKIEVENASKGTVKVYPRKANAAGKVVYTVVGRGTFYVTMYTGAAGAEVLSNTVTVKR